MPNIIYDLSKLPQEVREQILENPKYTKWFSEFPKKLLTIANDAKTVKNGKKGYRTGILYLSPASKSGVNVCAMALLAQCDKPCLESAGRGAMNSVQMGRLRKTLYFNQYREKFIDHLKYEVRLLCKYSDKHGWIPSIRPNGTSDIRWELLLWDFMVDTKREFGCQWYDYTKLVNRLVPDEDVYDLTFSYSGVERFQPFVKKAIKRGMRMAVVFRHQKDIPETFMGMDCVSGDEDDLTFLSERGVVRALYAKGKAVHDTTGFVVN